MRIKFYREEEKDLVIEYYNQTFKTPFARGVIVGLLVLVTGLALALIGIVLLIVLPLVGVITAAALALGAVLLIPLSPFMAIVSGLGLIKGRIKIS